ncbi:MAG: pyrimidine 5'-nucleotidase [Anaerolineales bacterium]|jgi:putative hydrolase of the HAD superfamily
MSFSTLFFDLDATLYSANNGLWDQIRNRIFQFMREVVGIPEQEVIPTRDHYWKTYGTTLEGLRIHHQVDPERYLAYVHEIPLEDYLQQDPELKEILASLPQELWVFTNSDRPHAQAVLDALGIREQFSGIIDLLAMGFAIKPQPEAYQIALKTAGVKDPTRSILFDDLWANLLGARSQGMKTALVNLDGQENGADYHLARVHDIKEIIPQLWSGS